MIVLNFAHPLSAELLGQAAALAGQEITAVIDEPSQTQVDPAQPLVPQISAMVDALGLSAAQWQGEPILVNLPGYAPVLAVLLAELNGRMGYFPAMMRLRAVPDAVPRRREVAELIDLQTVRDAVRRARRG